jgi:hypothetical protein
MRDTNSGCTAGFRPARARPLLETRRGTVIYGHCDQTDLETAMETQAHWLEQQREDGSVPPEAGR